MKKFKKLSNISNNPTIFFANKNKDTKISIRALSDNSMGFNS